MPNVIERDRVSVPPPKNGFLIKHSDNKIFWPIHTEPLSIMKAILNPLQHNFFEFSRLCGSIFRAQQTTAAGYRKELCVPRAPL
jgi:hypothetical protein